MRKRLRDLLDSRSISFRLYMIIVPITILAILLISYVDIQVVSRLLEWQIRDNALNIAGNLAQDLSRLNAPDAESLHSWTEQLLETNSYIRRIDVFRMVGGNLSRIDTTSLSNAPPISIEEAAAMKEGRPRVLPQYYDRERALKVIVPYTNPLGTVMGCVSVTSSLHLVDLVVRVNSRIDLILIPFSVLTLVVMLHYLFSRGLTGRIGRLGHAMVQARSGAAGNRAPVDRLDELGNIARTFNETMDEIERASRERDRLLEEQKNFNKQLQEKVREATQELTDANLQLNQVNQDLIDAQRRLTRYERMAVAAQMAAAFAHEVGSPLSAISTHLELMAEESGCSDDTKRRIRLIQEQVNRITGFVEDLQAETRAAARVYGSVQVNDILNQLRLFLSQHLQRRGIILELSLQEDLPEIDANAQQLQQVFLNLLNNAADAMPDGGSIKLATRVVGEEPGRKIIEVEITDNGIGITPEEQKRIFDPFFSTKDLRRGTGLGLSIAAGIIRQHRGSIGLESESGKGTTFRIRFPARPEGQNPAREKGII